MSAAAGEINPALAAEEWRPAVSPWIIAITVMLATFMEVLDTSVANVALPHIAGSLSASTEESTWLLTSYLVSNAIVLPLSGWFSRLMGRKRFYMACVTLFTISSFLCGLAPDLGSLILFRILQGAGGGALQPVSQAILVESFPRSKQGMAMAVYGMGVVVAPILGPTLGGWVTDNYSWRWIFLINIPVGAISLMMTYALVVDPPYIQRMRRGDGIRIDYIGLALLSIGLGFLQVILDKGQQEDWFESRWIFWMSIVVVAALVGVVVWELRQKDPLVDLRLLADRNFALSSITMFFLGFVLYGSIMLLPLYLQTLMGYNATLAGMVMSPGGLVTLAAMPIVGRLLGKVQARWLLLFGLITTSLSLIQMAGFNLQTDYRTAVIARCVQGLGLSCLFVPLNTMAFSYISKERTNNATGIINLARNIGGSFGIATVTTILARRSQYHQSVLVEHLTPYDTSYQMVMQNMIGRFTSAGSSMVEATTRTYQSMMGMVSRQAAMLSYIDAFWLLAVAFLAMVPLAFLMKRTRSHPGPVAAH